jgi:hypothetical protein
VTTPLAARRAAERWFLDRGLPSVLTRRGRLRSVWPRSAPALTGYAVLSACTLVIFLLTGGTIEIDGRPTAIEWVVLVIVSLAVPFVVIAGRTAARMATDRAQTVASGMSVVFVAISETISGGLTGLLSAAVTVVLLLTLTALGLGSVIGWAAKLTLAQFAAAGALLIRALPVVLLSVLVFFNTCLDHGDDHQSVEAVACYRPAGRHRGRLRHVRHVRAGKTAPGVGDRVAPARRASDRHPV